MENDMTTTKKARRAKAKTKATKAMKIENTAKAATDANAKIFARVQDSFRDAGEALREAGGLAGDQSRKIALKVIANAEENLTQGFDTLRAVLEADNFAEAMRIQQEALRETFERNLKQIREVTEMLTAGSQTALKPLGKFVANFRDTPRKKAA
jgi:hypothetical protein